MAKLLSIKSETEKRGISDVQFHKRSMPVEASTALLLQSEELGAVRDDFVSGNSRDSYIRVEVFDQKKTVLKGLTTDSWGVLLCDS